MPSYERMQRLNSDAYIAARVPDEKISTKPVRVTLPSVWNRTNATLDGVTTVTLGVVDNVYCPICDLSPSVTRKFTIYYLANIVVTNHIAS
jgi:hypothetical protein